MNKLPPPDLKIRPSAPLPTWMRLLPKGFPANCRSVGQLPPPNLTVQRDPALVEWMGLGMLRTRIFPINPGETKRVVVRFQSVATREGDALRVDYFGGTRPDASRQGAERTPVNLILEYPDRAGFGRAYSPTHTLDVNDRGSSFEARVRGERVIRESSRSRARCRRV